MTTKCATALLWIGIAVLPQAGAAQILDAQPRRRLAAAQGPVRVMTLDDALALAEAKNEQIAIATAGVTRAQGDEMRARSEIFPQFSASAVLRSRAGDAVRGHLRLRPDRRCTPLTVNPAAPIADRITEIERALQDCPPSSNFFGGGSGGGSGEGEGESENELPFGQANTISLNLIFSQNALLGRTHRGDSASARGSRARIPS